MKSWASAPPPAQGALGAVRRGLQDQCASAGPGAGAPRRAGLRRQRGSLLPAGRRAGGLCRKAGAGRGAHAQRHRPPAMGRGVPCAPSTSGTRTAICWNSAATRRPGPEPRPCSPVRPLCGQRAPELPLGSSGAFALLEIPRRRPPRSASRPKRACGIRPPAAGPEIYDG
jgi:hypothetical protein